MIEVAGCMIRDSGDRLLLLHKQKRGQNEAQDFWELPGGKLEPGETPAQAAVREGGEELGVVVWVDEDPLLVQEIKINQKVYRYSYFEAGITNNNAPMVIEPIHVDMKYMDQDEMYRRRSAHQLSVFVLRLLDCGVAWLPRTA